MLDFVRNRLRRFILGYVDLAAIQKDHKALLDEVARLQTEVASHRGRLKALENDVLASKNVAQRIQALESESVRLSGCIQAAVNAAGAANSRGERNETRIGAIEHQFRQRSVSERDSGFLQGARPPLPPSDEDVELPTKQKVCATCRGGCHLVDALGYKTHPCPSCLGTGSIEVIPG